MLNFKYIIRVGFGIWVLYILLITSTSCKQSPPKVLANDALCDTTFVIQRTVFDTLILEKLIFCEDRKGFLYNGKCILDKRVATIKKKSFIKIVLERIAPDTITERYNCSQLVLNYSDDISPIQKKSIQRYLVDSLKMGIVKSCPCSDIEVWGKENGLPLEPEEVVQGRQSSVGQNSGNDFEFSTSLNFVFDLPYRTDSILETNGDKRLPFEILIPPSTKKDTFVQVALIDSGIDKSFGLSTNTQIHSRYRWKNDPEINGVKGKDDNISCNCYIDDEWGYDFVNDKPINSQSGTIDFNGHGTHVAGLIAGANIADDYDLDIRIMDLKIFHKGYGTLGDLICATDYAIKNGAEIINQSLGFYSFHPPQALVDVFKKARKMGILIVTSAGNDGWDNDNLFLNNNTIKFQHYPSDVELKNVISVGALSDNDPNQLWISDTVGSNYGETMVDVVAPGEKVWSSYPGGAGKLSGTSMAAGQITRIAAIMKEQGGGKALQLRNCLIKFGNPTSGNLSPIRPLKTKNPILDYPTPQFTSSCN